MSGQQLRKWRCTNAPMADRLSDQEIDRIMTGSKPPPSSALPNSLSDVH